MSKLPKSYGNGCAPKRAKQMGFKGSEVQILSPRPKQFKQISGSPQGVAAFLFLRCPVVGMGLPAVLDRETVNRMMIESYQLLFRE